MGYTINITWELQQKMLLKNFKLQESSRMTFAASSQRKATEAITAKKFKDEIVPIN